MKTFNLRIFLSSPINRFLIATFSKTIYLMPALIVPYFLKNGYSAADAALYMSIYSFSIVILEYPTGVIADYFGYKYSVVLSQVLWIFSYIILLLNPPLGFVYFSCILVASSAALDSGADDAWLKVLSGDDYKSKLRLVSLFWTNGILIGSIIATAIMYFFSVNFGIMVNIASIFIGLMFYLSTPSIHLGNRAKKDTNIFSTINLGFKYISSSRLMILFIAMLAMLQGFIWFSKTLFSTFSDLYGLELYMAGVLVATIMIAKSIALWTEKYTAKIKDPVFAVIVILAMFFATVFSQNIIINIISLIIFFMSLQILYFRAKVQLTDNVDSEVRASVLSFSSLFGRLSSGVLMLTLSYFLGQSNYTGFNYFILIIIIPIAFFVYKVSRSDPWKETGTQG